MTGPGWDTEWLVGLKGPKMWELGFPQLHFFFFFFKKYLIDNEREKASTQAGGVTGRGRGRTRLPSEQRA